MRRADTKVLPSLEALRHLFIYDPETGVVRWRVKPHPSAQRIKPGDIAGTARANDYLVIGIARSYFLAHRIIWKLQTGEDPADLIDHRDGDKSNNRWSNLRAATKAENRVNARINKNNTTGVKGVYWYRKKFVAYVTVNKKRTKLGRFDTLQEAAEVRARAAHRAYGEFQRAA